MGTDNNSINVGGNIISIEPYYYDSTTSYPATTITYPATTSSSSTVTFNNNLMHFLDPSKHEIISKNAIRRMPESEILQMIGDDLVIIVSSDEMYCNSMTIGFKKTGDFFEKYMPKFYRKYKLLLK